MNQERREVQVVFREIESTSPTQVGPDRPIVGATLDAGRAAELARKNRQWGVHWITIELRNEADDGYSESIILAVLKGIWGDDVYTDPSPEAAFTSRTAAAAWLDEQPPGSREYVFLEVPLEVFDLNGVRSREANLD
ncbi:hypothetical protein ACFQS2_01685 [Brachybacterium sp. GCM10030267]|uniref:hypothetical protein n=1 Tax=Brachybacterium sp. GCM10030267 TaxID=3273381 RepID=UPI00361B3E67